MDAQQQDRILLAAKNWRETEKMAIAAKGEFNPAARDHHHHAKLRLRNAVDDAIKSGAQP